MGYLITKHLREKIFPQIILGQILQPNELQKEQQHQKQLVLLITF